MILYYSPGACSLVAHIALHESGAEFAAERTVLMDGAHRTEEYRRINPHQRVPALVTDGGVITENIAINSYIGLIHRRLGSVPFDDPMETARTLRLLSWFASSVHIAFAQIWRPERFTSDASLHDGVKQGGREALERYFAEIEELAGDGWVAGGDFTAADSYLLTFFRWGRRIGFDMADYPRWAGHAGRVLERPAVRQAIAMEGLETAEFQVAVEAAL